MDSDSLLPLVHQQHPSTDAIFGRQELIDRNCGHLNVVVCERDYRALKQGDRALPPPPQ
jgi:hypothetical protein